MNDLKSQINKALGKKSRILGVWDDEEERWIKFPEEEIEGILSMGISEIPQFVKDAVREVQRLGQTFPIEKLSFDLNIRGNRIRFTILLGTKEEKT